MGDKVFSFKVYVFQDVEVDVTARDEQQAREIVNREFNYSAFETGRAERYADHVEVVDSFIDEIELLGREEAV
jgi:hypothetical protein